MKKYRSTFLVVVALLACIPEATQSSDFNRVQLSPKGRIAYDTLRSACIFGVGGTSKEESALYQLLEERHSVEALKSLVTAGTYEGGLYGLLGLSFTDKAEFDHAVEIYNARKELPEWQTTGSFECFTPTRDTVTTASGCIITTESRAKVVTMIQSGRSDRLPTSIGAPQRSNLFRAMRNKALQLTAR